MRRLLSGLPAGGTVVAGSRDIPDLGLGKLWAHGLLRDKRRLALGDDEIAKLQRCIEGWAAALRLMSDALQFAGREEFAHTFIEEGPAVARLVVEPLTDRELQVLLLLSME